MSVPIKYMPESACPFSRVRPSAKPARPEPAEPGSRTPPGAHPTGASSWTSSVQHREQGMLVCGGHTVHGVRSQEFK